MTNAGITKLSPEELKKKYDGAPKKPQATKANEKYLFYIGQDLSQLIETGGIFK